MNDFYIVVEETRNWDWEREEELVRSHDKALCERIAQDLTNHIDHVREKRSGCYKDYYVKKEYVPYTVSTWEQWLENRNGYGDIEE